MDCKLIDTGLKKNSVQLVLDCGSKGMIKPHRFHNLAQKHGFASAEYHYFLIYFNVWSVINV